MNYSNFSNPKSLYNKNNKQTGYSTKNINNSIIDNNEFELKNVFYVIPQAKPNLYGKIYPATSKTINVKNFNDSIRLIKETALGKDLLNYIESFANRHVYFSLIPNEKLIRKTSNGWIKTFGRTFTDIVDVKNGYYVNKHQEIEINLENFPEYQHPSLEGFQCITVSNSENKLITLISFNSDFFKNPYNSETEKSNFIKRRIALAFTIYHELYAHIRIFDDFNTNSDGIKEHEIFGSEEQIFSGFSLEQKIEEGSPAGKIIKQLFDIFKSRSTNDEKLINELTKLEFEVIKYTN